MFEDKNQCENFGVTLTRTVRGLISDKLYDIKNNRSVLLILSLVKYYFVNMRQVQPETLPQNSIFFFLFTKYQALK
jgi:hypothetical protein